MPFKYSFFISYTLGQSEFMKEFIRQIKEALQDRLELYLDLEGFLDDRLRPGSHYNEELAKAICQSICMLVIYTPKYENHLYCLREFRAMERIGKHRKKLLGYEANDLEFIIPIILRGDITDIPPTIKDRIYFDFRKFALATPIKNDPEYNKEIEKIAWIIYHNYILFEEKGIDPCSDCDSFILPSEKDLGSWRTNPFTFPSKDKMDVWGNKKHSSASSISATASSLKSQIRFAVSGFSADICTERDLIGIGAEVDAFAYLIAAKALQPPMAIGLFGDWGSGKSFFMESLRQRIHKITADAQKSNLPQKEISIYKYIAQIEFNAWHYVEGDLWASLVEHIFCNLKIGSEDKLPLLQERQKAVIEKLKNSNHFLKDAQTRIDLLQSQLSQTEKKVIELESERDAALKKLKKLKVTGILKEIKLSEEEKKNIRQASKDLGVVRPETTEAELMLIADELRDVLERGNALITPLREYGWKWVAVLIIILFIAPIFGLVLSRIFDFPPVTNALLSVSAILSGLAFMLKKGTVWLSNAQARVSTIHLKLEEKRRAEAAKYRKDINEAMYEYEKTEVEYNKAENDKKQQEIEIERLKLELQRITPGSLLHDFINERICSDDYRKHLGIAALIRRDFEQLSKLIADQNKELDEEKDKKIKNKDQLLLNRVVLYIDDLDRCPSDRVVQVLEAVHLLLTFPLFVVVVAVDARWLSQSLQSHYQNLLTNSTQKDSKDFSNGFGRQATPQDYLEKIFQVPFWVRPLPEKARMRIVKGLVLESLTLSLSNGAENVKKQQNNKQTNSKEISDTQVEKEQDYWDPSELRRPLDVDASTDLKPQGLDIGQIELEFMDDLSSLLGQTPRSVKRFINVYRLIKAISLNHKENFVEDKPDADFKLVLFLLAVLTGLSSISGEFLKQLHRKRSEVEQAQKPEMGAARPIGHTVAQVLEELHGVILGTSQTITANPILIGRDAKVSLDEERNCSASGWGYDDRDVCRDLERLESWLNKYKGGIWLNFDADALADWAPSVVRFSSRREEL